MQDYFLTSNWSDLIWPELRFGTVQNSNGNSTKLSNIVNFLIADISFTKYDHKVEWSFGVLESYLR